MMHHTIVAILLGVLLASGAPAWADQCDPTQSAVELASLLGPIGDLACKLPANVDLANVMGQLGGILKSLNLNEVKQLPGLVDATISVNPAALQPFFSLSATEINALVPLLTSVSAEKLQVVLPLLAKQPDSTLEKVTVFLRGITLSKLQQLTPLFSTITQSQVDVLATALNVLPQHAITKLTFLLQAFGSVTDVVVTAKQSKGLLPNYSSSSRGAAVNGVRFGPFGFGRKLKATACVAADKGIEVGTALLTNVDLGAAVCKFTSAELLPVFEQTLKILLKQNQQTLANLPAFTATLTKVQPAALQAFFQVPQPTLKALVPVLQGLDANTVTRQLKSLASQGSDTINKMIYFINNTPNDKFQILIPFFTRLSGTQVATFTSLANSLSAGQLSLALHLLNTFNFNVNTIGSNMPSNTAASSTTTFMIGPIRVTKAVSSAGTSVGTGAAATGSGATGWPKRVGPLILG